MAVEFQHSQTKQNLIAAFAGENQAYRQYTDAARRAGAEGYPVIEGLFQLIAQQEKKHAEIFYSHLCMFHCETIQIDTGGGFGMGGEDVVALLLEAQAFEDKKGAAMYGKFGQTAGEEGFGSVAQSFGDIALIEKNHGERFGMCAEMICKQTLFAQEKNVEWMCMQCGYLYVGDRAPAKCCVCRHSQGSFIHLNLSMYGC